jgi:redox-sensitive bicupin YhaK (pirin superfamily)
MTDRTTNQLVTTEPQPGTGILRPFPSRSLGHVDPFVFLDTGEPLVLGTGDIYVGPHPHRGFQPVSLLFRGRITHRDSLDNHATIESGGVQWLVAGSGALHEEVLEGDDEGVFHMAQLWVNLPAELKMQAPSHHAVPAAEVPNIASLGPGSTLRLYAGDLAGETGPAPLPTPVLVAHVTLQPSGSVTIPVPSGWNVAITIVDGKAATSDGRPLGPGDTPVFNDDGGTITIHSDGGGQFLLMAGAPIGEPIVMGGSFVMNTEDEINAAFADYRAGNLGTLPPSR